MARCIFKGRFVIASSLSCLAVALTSCSAPATDVGVYDPDQYAVLKAQSERLRKVEVTLTARVLKLLSDDTRGLPHQRFLVALANGTTVLVAHDTAIAPRVPVKPGDVVTIHGEYIWNEKGGVIHWTHRSNTPAHEGGWIDLNGMRYQ